MVDLILILPNLCFRWAQKTWLFRCCRQTCARNWWGFRGRLSGTPPPYYCCCHPRWVMLKQLQHEILHSCDVLRRIASCCDVLSGVEASEAEVSKAEVSLPKWTHIGIKQSGDGSSQLTTYFGLRTSVSWQVIEISHNHFLFFSAVLSASRRNSAV